MVSPSITLAVPLMAGELGGRSALGGDKVSDGTTLGVRAGSRSIAHMNAGGISSAATAIRFTAMRSG